MKLLARSLALIAIPTLVAFLCIVRVPPGCLGIAGGSSEARVLGPGLHLRPPLSRVEIYAQEPATVERRAVALTREGARVDVTYAVRAGVDPSRAASLSGRMRGGTSAGEMASGLAALVEEALASASQEDDGAGLEPRVRRHLENAGLRVELLSVTPAQTARISAPGAARLRHPILLVGLDGADWQIADPLIAQGRLPILEHLRSRAVWGHMRSFEPILSPLLWTTVVTGKPPDEHGVVDFLVPDVATGRKVPITSRQRKTRALWNIFSERGLTSDFVAWWASWPAERINGRMVSDRVAYSLFQVAQEQTGLTSPASLWEDIRTDVRSDAAFGYEKVARFLDIARGDFDAARRRVEVNPPQAYKEPINHLTKILASTDTYHRIALRLLADHQPDLFAVYYQGIDEVSHRFAHFMAPRMAMVSEPDFRRYRRAVEEFYVYQDELLGELLGKISPATTVIVMSDHGFHNGASRPIDGPADIEGKPGKWHRLYGIVMVAGEGIRPGRFDTATLFDIAPTVLALAGLPLAEDMKGVPLLDRESSAQAPERIATYETEAPVMPIHETAEQGSLSQADEELLRNLASLGYTGGAESAPSPSAAHASLQAASPQTVTAHTNMASILSQKGDLKGAEAELRRALALKPAYFPALMTLSQVLVRQGRIQEALESTRKAVASAEDAEPGSYVQLAMLAARAGQSAQATSFLTALQQRRPRSAGIETALGVLAMDAGRREAAEARFRTALAIQPASTDALGRLFQLYRERGREGDLEPEVRQGLSRNDLSVLHHNWLGLILARRGDGKGAEKEFRRALELAPDFGGTMANLGSLYGRMGRLEEAVAVLSRALRIEPRNLEARVNLGASLAKLGRLDEAIAHLEGAQRIGLRSPDLLNAMGLAYAQKGQTRLAIEALQESLTLSPAQPQVKSLLSELTQPT